MKKLEFGKPVVSRIESGSNNSHQVLVGLWLGHWDNIEGQVVLEAIFGGSVLPAAHVDEISMIAMMIVGYASL
jgi:hypothetical protein